MNEETPAETAIRRLSAAMRHAGEAITIMDVREVLTGALRGKPIGVELYAANGEAAKAARRSPGRLTIAAPDEIVRAVAGEPSASPVAVYVVAVPLSAVRAAYGEEKQQQPAVPS